MFINYGRGSIIDEASIINALEYVFMKLMLLCTVASDAPNTKCVCLLHETFCLLLETFCLLRFVVKVCYLL